MPEPSRDYPRRSTFAGRLAGLPHFASAGILALLVLCLVGPVSPIFAAANEPSFLTGRVLDELGRGVSDVDVLVFQAGRELPRQFLGDSRTNEVGRFRFLDLDPGPYLLTLSKPGYQILLAQVNTRIRSWVILTLLPGATGNLPIPSLEPASMEWVLRSPRSDLLKEWRAKGPPVGVDNTEPASTLPVRGAVPAVDAEAAHLSSLPVNGEVEHWVTSELPFLAGGSEAAASKGRTTTLGLSGELGERGHWEVGGLTGSLVTEPETSRNLPEETDQGADQLQVAMHYDVRPGDSVRFRARYDRQSLKGTEPFSSPSLTEQEVRSWGYQAGWVREMDRGQELEMKVGFLHASGRVPQILPEPRTQDEGREEAVLEDRQWTLGALYGFDLSPAHRVSVEARTRSYEVDPRTEDYVLTPGGPAFGLAQPGARGWVISLSGEDAWQISSPISLTLGIDYHRADRLGGFSLFVPRFGAKREGERLVVEGHLLVRVRDEVAEGAESAEPEPDPWGSENPIGFRGEYLYRLGETWTLGGHVERNPFDLDDQDLMWELTVHPARSGGLFVVDPTATSRELGILLEKKFRGVRGSLASEGGRVSGRVSSRFDESPIKVLNEAEIRYLALRASASVDRTETEVRIDYRRMEESPTGSLWDEPSRTTRLDLVVLQDLSFLKRWGSADWRVLFACQALERDLSVTEADGFESQRIHRFSGGVGVRF